MGHHGVFQRSIIKNIPSQIQKATRHVNFDRAPMPMDSEIYIGAVALVDVALNMNTDARRVWVAIICAWNKPADMLMSEVNGEFGGYLQEILSDTTIEDKKLTSSGYKKWEAKFGWNPDSIALKNAVNNFILAAYNGPTEPKSYQRMGLDIYRYQKPTRKTAVTPGTIRPELKHAICFISFFDKMKINPEDADRDTMGDDYEIVTTGKKPTTKSGRKRRAVINEILRNAHVTYKQYDAIYDAAEKWYRAKVIRGSVTEVALEDGNNRATYSSQITLFNHITGLS